MMWQVLMKTRHWWRTSIGSLHQPKQPLMLLIRPSRGQKVSVRFWQQWLLHFLSLNLAFTIIKCHNLWFMNVAKSDNYQFLLAGTQLSKFGWFNESLEELWTRFYNKCQWWMSIVFGALRSNERNNLTIREILSALSLSLSLSFSST